MSNYPYYLMICGKVLVTLGILTGSLSATAAHTDVPLFLVGLGAVFCYLALGMWVIERLLGGRRAR